MYVYVYAFITTVCVYDVCMFLITIVCVYMK